MAEAALSVAPRQLGAELAAALRPQPLVYWLDLLASAGFGWGLFAWATTLVPGSPLHLACTLGAAIALLRAGYFAHEIAHLSRRAVPGFEWVWHLVAGIPLLIPSLMVGAHKHHHRVASYGTVDDPEYAAIARWPAWRFALDLASIALVPGLLILRWGVVGPLSWPIPPLRRLVEERLSTLAINPAYRRPALTRAERRQWVVQEWVMAGFVWSMASLVWSGAIPISWVIAWWGTTALALLLNQVRTYVAHAYENDGAPMDIDAQVRDTLTLGGIFLLTDLLAPLGDRYHAAHHRYPSLPYHALPAAHRALCEQLRGDAPYAATFRNGLSGALAALVRRARA